MDDKKLMNLYNLVYGFIRTYRFMTTQRLSELTFLNEKTIEKMCQWMERQEMIARFGRGDRATWMCL